MAKWTKKPKLVTNLNNKLSAKEFHMNNTFLPRRRQWRDTPLCHTVGTPLCHAVESGVAQFLVPHHCLRRGTMVRCATAHGVTLWFAAPLPTV
jgi:hypothetical protein